MRVSMLPPLFSIFVEDKKEGDNGQREKWMPVLEGVKKFEVYRRFFIRCFYSESWRFLT